MLGLVAGAAAAVGIVTLVSLIPHIMELATGTVTITGVPITNAASPDFTVGIVDARYETLALILPNAPEAVRASLIAGTAIGAVVTAGICAAIAWLCVRVFIGRPFVRSATWGLGIAAILVILGALGGGLFHGIAQAEAIRSLGDAVLAGGGEGLQPLMLEIDLAPIGWGFALAVVAGAFELGQRLQRDTEGLV